VEATQAQQTGPNNPSELYAAVGGVGNNTNCLRIPHFGQRSRAMLTGVASHTKQHLSANRSFIDLPSPHATTAKDADLLIIKVPGVGVRQHYRQTLLPVLMDADDRPPVEVHAAFSDGTAPSMRARQPGDAAMISRGPS
jgi:hypothetical protein